MIRWSFALFLALGSLGCVDTDLKLRDPSPRTPSPPPVAANLTPISADQVTPTNARQMAHAVWAEMDREELAPAAPEVKKK